MRLAHLQIDQFRNIATANIDFASHVNIVAGPNGSGKTSFLEAIHCLVMGRSFRTRLNSRLIQTDAERFTLFARLENDDQTASLIETVGIEKSRANQPPRIRYCQQTIPSILPVTMRLPLRLITPDSWLILNSGASVRRRIVDWGLFHVEPLFYDHWREARRIIMQRNALLRQGSVTPALLEPWDEQLQHVAHQLDQLRTDYASRLQILVVELVRHLFQTDHTLSLRYSAGWDTSKSLKEILAQARKRDVIMGFTHHGPQRADLQFYANNIQAHEILSQGQQKLLVYALLVAQGRLLQAHTGRKCLFLLDDLEAALDARHQQALLEMLYDLDGQLFITSLRGSEMQKNVKKNLNTQIFCIDQGKITPHKVRIQPGF